GTGWRGEGRGGRGRDLPGQFALPRFEDGLRGEGLAGALRIRGGRLRLLRGDDLGIPLVGAEEPDAVAPRRTAQREAVIVRVLIDLLASERLAAQLVDALVLRVPVVVGDEDTARTVKRVGAALGDDVDDRALEAAVLRGHRRVVDDDLLDRVEVVVGAEGARGRVRRVDAVEQEDVTRVRRTARVGVAVAVDVVLTG